MAGIRGCQMASRVRALTFGRAFFTMADRMRSTIRISVGWLFVAAFVASASGCSWFARMFPAGASDGTARPAARNEAEVAPPLDRRRSGGAESADLVVVRLAFDVTRLIVPSANLVAQREAVWREIDELRVSPAVHSHLRRNGFRLGVIRAGARDRLRGILDAADARYERMAHTVQSGVPLSIDLGSVAGSVDVFLIAPDGTLAGHTFNDVAKFIHIDYEVSVDDGPRALLRITPELFKESVRPGWRVRDGAPSYKKVYEGVMFHELAADVDVKTGELLILGPANADEQPWTLGSRMLVDTIGGRAWETILCIEPRVYRHAEAERQQP